MEEPAILKDYKATFARLVMDAIASAGERRALRYRAGTFEITLAGSNWKDDLRFFLGNTFHEYISASPDHRADVLQRGASCWMSSVSLKNGLGIAEARPNLRPMIRDRGCWEFDRLRARASKKDHPFNEVPCRVIAQDLALGLAYDSANTLRWITQNELTHWNFSFDDALFIATENLRKVSPEDFERLGDGTYRSPWDDCYDSARLLFMDRIRSLDVRGRHVAMVPNRNTLLVTGADDEQGLALIIRETLAARGRPRYATGVAVTLDGDEWVPYMPEGNSPVHRALMALRLESLSNAYAEQAQLLEQLDGTNQVAKFIHGFDKQSDTAFSMCALMLGAIPVLLPKTDRILVLDASSAAVQYDVTWDEFVAATGDFLQPQRIYPERYLVKDLTPEQLHAVRSNFDCDRGNGTG